MSYVQEGHTFYNFWTTHMKKEKKLTPAINEISSFKGWAI